MNLVDYSDSESSNSETENIGSSPLAPRLHHAAPPSKPAKKQIIVDLPKPSRVDQFEEQAKKRPRPHGEGGGGLFAILPPPKRSKPNTDRTPKAVESETKSVETSDDVNPADTETPPPKPVTTTSFMPRSTQAKKKAQQAKQPEPATNPALISLFPLGPDLISRQSPSSTSTTPSTYEPLIAKPLAQDPFPLTGDNPDNQTSHDEPPKFIPDATATMSTADLDSFAAHILEGRHRKNRTIKIMDFNAGEMYAQNAADKASGVLADQVAPVRAIGTGRHQLTQLLNNVQDQRESLEEAFARNRQVKKESGAKYGW